MGPKLYYILLGAPSRASLLTIKALGIDVELVPLKLMEQEHLTPEFLQKNPLHTVPTLEEDNGWTIFDSHAINAYLVTKYGNDDSLYPKDPQQRAVVDQRLHFESSVLGPRLATIVVSLLRGGAKSVSKDKADAVIQGYTSLETLLENKFVAGNNVTIADFNIATAITSSNALVPIASNRFPKISEWLSRMEALPYFAEANKAGLNLFTSLMKSKITN